MKTLSTVVDIDISYATALIAAVLLGFGFVLQQYAAEQEPQSRFLSLRILTDLLRKPRWLTGIVFMVGGQILAAWSIGHLELTVVEPLLTTYLLFALILAVPMSRQRLRWPEAAGALILVAGVALLSVARSVTPVGGELAFGSPSNWWGAAVIAGIALVVVRAGRRRTGEVRATLTGVAAGLVFGIQDALTRQTLEILFGKSPGVLFTNWAPYALVGAGILGLWLMQNAFSAAPLHASLPAIAGGEPVVGILLGIVVFGDTVQADPGMLALQAAGLALLIAGVVMVARSSALGGLARIGTAIRDHTPHTRPIPDTTAARPVPDTTAARPVPGTTAARPAPDLNQQFPGPGPDGQSPNGQSPDGWRQRRAARRDHGPVSGSEGR
ncbi:MAG: DMT family transporter [Streptosporangiaceae bacterium]|nr:DMT family transporter [Streptosporangiaceae bacterium]